MDQNSLGIMGGMDRAVANKQWCEFFPYAGVSVLANRASDNNPLIMMFSVREGGARHVQRPFRYEARWAKLEGFREVVKKGWWVKHRDKDPWIAVKENLQSCRGVIKRWVRMKTNNSEALIQCKAKKFEELQ